MLYRPCFLVVDREFSGNISTRKLIIETAKFNVITAYSGNEAVETLRAFPAVAGIVLDAEVRDGSCAELIAKLRGIKPDVPIVAVSAPGADHCTGATHHLEGFDPASLLELLKKLQPQAAAEIARTEINLEKR